MRMVKTCHLNVGTGLDISIHDLAEIIARECKFKWKNCFGTKQNRMELLRN